jgi:hypothetical protein
MADLATSPLGPTVSSTCYSPEAPTRAAYLAIPAARAALESARRVDSARGDITGHRLIGQAVGILMERYEITEDRALHCLQRMAVAGQVELREVARMVVGRVDARGRTTATALRAGP